MGEDVRQVASIVGLPREQIQALSERSTLLSAEVGGLNIASYLCDTKLHVPRRVVGIFEQLDVLLEHIFVRLPLCSVCCHTVGPEPRAVSQFLSLSVLFFLL